MKDILQLHALADNQLDPNEAAQVQAALQKDPELMAEYHAVLSIKDCLQSKVSSVTCDETWRTCVGRLNEIDRTRRVEGFVGRYAWALCGVFFLFIVYGGISNRGKVGTASMETADLAHMMTNFGASAPTERSQMDRSLDALLLRAMLNSADKKGFGLVHAVRLAAGLELLNSQKFDIVLLDMSLPDSSGIDTFKRVREKTDRVAVSLA